ncbi:MAG: hypothetical protein QXI32_01585 [Candidatus Bathyarchaeia archaeon]
MPQRVFISDCEGPISKNDNAFELAAHFIPEGDRFFRILSRYDDVLAYFEGRSGYSAGYTLRLVAPFLKAYGATNKSIAEFSRRGLLLIRNAKPSLERIQRILPAFIVSTSYSPYIEALCAALSFPKENTFSTYLDLDSVHLSLEETLNLQQLSKEILAYPEIEIPEHAKCLDDLPASSRIAVSMLDKVFWEYLPNTGAGKIIHNIHPIGSIEKQRAVQEITRAMSTSMDCVFYVGDSITDADVLRTVRDSGGVSVSFNGNQYAVRNAEFCVLSESMEPICRLVESFAVKGRLGVLETVEEIQRMCSTSTYPSLRPVCKVCVIGSFNLEEIIQESLAFRRMVRGESVAALG